ncbi:hypothetical protein [Paenibacillus xylanexedens]|uniref:hypothetical protein n=1 Tax=Paenibacillus xylanexedens TaxID=528191 RepID=UPI001C92FB8A|nr:hypothetical protein [Paenibacillus xylanexedens]
MNVSQDAADSDNNILMHRAHALGPAEEFRGSRGSRTHPTSSDTSDFVGHIRLRRTS